MNFSFAEFLISFSVTIDSKFKSDMKNVIKETRNIGFAVERLNNFQIPITNSVMVQIKIKKRGVKMTEKKFIKLADEQEKLLNKFVPSSNKFSDLGEEVYASMLQINVNMKSRFLESGLNDITGQLDQAIENIEPVFYQYNNGSIRTAIANIKELSESTPPYSIDKETGEAYLRENPGTYSYDIPGKTVRGTGYWMFQEFGTSRGISPRSFLLALSRDAHGEDASLLRNISRWISDTAKEFEKNSTKILR